MKSKLIILAISIPGILNAQCADNVVTNGSFVDDEGSAVQIPGWTIFSSPDVNDSIGDLNSTFNYVWIGQPLDSENGGTWANLFGFEALEQVLTVTPNQEYLVTFEFSAQGITNGGTFVFDGPAGLRVLIDGQEEFVSPLDSTQYTWETHSFTFTPTTSSVTIKFEGTQQQYIGLDGICVVPNIATSITGFTKSEGLRFFPNPVNGNDELTVQLSGNRLKSVEVYDMTGKKVLTKYNIDAEEIKLQTEALAAGVFIMNVSTVGNELFTRKFMVR